MLMSVTHRVDHSAKQFQALADVQLSLVAPAMDRLAVHELHHEIRPTLISDASVEKLGDIGVIERSQDFALLLEPGDYGCRVSRWQHQFDGGLTVECFVGPLSEIDSTHSTAADLADQRVSTE